jgi:uncharacterized 2Fe-2S/4Fe-4S cluster protein (DUF4445 family)
MRLLDTRVKVLFEPYGRKVEARIPGTILEVAQYSGIGVRSECGGKQVCGKCRVIVKDQVGLNGATDKEKLILSEDEIVHGYRLACDARLTSGADKITVMVPVESRFRPRRFTEWGKERRVKPEPTLRKYPVRVAEPSLDDNRSDVERLLDALHKEQDLVGLAVDLQAVRELPNILRSSDLVTVVVRDESEVISVEAGVTSEKLFGLAVDVGTSKITCNLVDLNNGETIISRSMENPQIVYGEDVISRIAFSQEKAENRLMLQESVIGGVNTLIWQLCRETSLSPENVYEVVLVGNTAMHHLLLGLEPRYLARAPFTPVSKSPVDVKARDLGVKINPCGHVLFLPIIDGFVGADAVADILSAGIYRPGGPILLLDIGTNTEVILRREDRVICCSCASGPAFEGVHIEHGMKAVDGAIEKIRIDKETYEVEFEALGDDKPVGLCGSAIIDAVAQLLQSGVISGLGKFNANIKTPRLRKAGNSKEFVIAWGEEAGIDGDLTISERDINEVLLAKAAIYSASAVLMGKLNIGKEDLKKVLIAGAFGSQVDKRNAKTIGLIPDVDDGRIRFLGNSALTGARMALVSRRMRRLAEGIPAKVEYVELATSPDFKKEFTNALWLPNRNPVLFPAAEKSVKKRG